MQFVNFRLNDSKKKQLFYQQEKSPLNEMKISYKFMSQDLFGRKMFNLDVLILFREEKKSQ